MHSKYISQPQISPKQHRYIRKSPRFHTQTSDLIEQSLTSPLLIKTSGSNKQLDQVRKFHLNMKVSRQKYSNPQEITTAQTSRLKPFSPDQSKGSELMKGNNKSKITEGNEVAFTASSSIEHSAIHTQRSNAIHCQSHNGDKIIAYGAATFKGSKNRMNKHHIGIHRGSFQNFLIAEGYDGSAAASFIKNEYCIQLLKQYTIGKRSDDEPTKILENSLRNSFSILQAKLLDKQKMQQDNSGCTLVSLILKGNILFIANCGSSKVIGCNLSENAVYDLCLSHTTSNSKEMERIVGHGGSVYQTLVNIPYEMDLNLKGPLRLFPSQLMITRTLGKCFEFSRQQTLLSSRQAGIISEPEIKYLTTSELQWVAILSSNLGRTVPNKIIGQIMAHNLSRRSPTFDIHLAVQQISKQVIQEAIKRGEDDSLSIILLIFNVNPPKVSQNHTTLIQMIFKQNPQISQNHLAIMEKNRPKSLKYIGHRKDFSYE